LKNLDWGNLTDDLLDCLGVTQTQLSVKCRVTQQSVSNWKNGTRSPGVYARHVLRELAIHAKFDIDNYGQPQAGPVEIAVIEASISTEVLMFAKRLAELPHVKVRKIIDMSDFLMTYE
jgi:transcriptional regulator with XRE-family HTH domain